MEIDTKFSTFDADCIIQASTSESASIKPRRLSKKQISKKLPTNNAPLRIDFSSTSYKQFVNDIKNNKIFIDLNIVILNLYLNNITLKN